MEASILRKRWWITKNYFIFIVLSLFNVFTPLCWAQMSIVNTKHNLSVTGPGTIKSLVETRICIFCHTPHNAAPKTPLWNKDLEPINYVLYSSSTMTAKTNQPTGPSRLCLSCHDGTIALGDVRVPSNDIQVMGQIQTTSPSYIGTILSDDHPVSFSYYDSLPNPELAPTPPPGLIFYDNYEVHCTTCHDPHDDTNGMFLRITNAYSNLCTTCHFVSGWPYSSHKNASNVWNGSPPNPWPHTSFKTVAENGCENCHAPHSAGGPERLLNYLEEEANCYPCHNGHVASLDIESEMQKLSHHPVEATTIGITSNHHEPGESPLMISGHVECQDCHNPHAANSNPGTAPNVSGATSKVTGVSSLGTPVLEAQYEYEICFKCHADSSPGIPYIPRVVNETNKRYEFDLNNPSYHPVEGVGKNPNVPSIPSSYEPSMTTSTIIYCTDCHDSDNSRTIGGTGPRGPHGSVFEPILRERYETTDRTPESYDAYALCYRCHDRNSILQDQSFVHSEHLGQGATCAACHDPHGVRQDLSTGDHTHLINFDTRIVFPVSGQSYPIFTDKGTYAGSCTLVCHGKTHIGLSYQR